MNTSISTLPQSQFLPVQFQQMIQNQQNNLQQQHLLAAFQPQQIARQNSNDPQSPDQHILQNTAMNQGNSNISSGNIGAEQMSTVSNFGTPRYQNQYQAKGNLSSQTEILKGQSQQEIISGCTSSLSLIPQFCINSDNQIPSAMQINNSISNSCNNNSQADNRNQIPSQFLLNGSLPTSESIDLQQNLGNPLLNANPLLANLNALNQNNQGLFLQNIARPINQMNQNNPINQVLQNLQANPSALFAAQQFHSSSNSAQSQQDQQKLQIENLINQSQLASTLHNGNPNQLNFIQQLAQQNQIQQYNHILLQNQLLKQQQQYQQNQLELNPQQLLQQILLSQQQPNFLNNFNLNLQAPSSLPTNNQPCLVEEDTEDEIAEEDVIPNLKHEHESAHEEEFLQSLPSNKLPKAILPIPQQLGQIGSTLFDKQIFLNQLPSIQGLTKQISFPSISKDVIRPLIKGQKIEQKDISGEEDEEDDDNSDLDNDESEIQQMRNRQEQQQKLLKSLSRVYQMQPNISKMQNGEFQSPATPQQQKHQKYINPLRMEYQQFIMDSNTIKGSEKIKNAIFIAEHCNTQQLPFNYKSEFSHNLICLVESIHKNSIVRQNPHLLYGSISKSGRPQSNSFSSSITTRLFEAPQNHPQPKIEEFCIGSNNTNNNTNQHFLGDNFSLNGGFSIRNSLKKIDNNNSQSLQKNMSIQEEEFSSDSFGQNIEAPTIRPRQISNLSGISGNGQSPSQIRSHKQSFTTNGMNTPTLNPVQSQQQSERTLLNLYSTNLGKDRERSKQFATAKNTQGNRSRTNTETSVAASPLVTASPGGMQKRSKYHNLTKLFMYFLLSLFSSDNMERLGVPEHIQQELIKCVQNVKKTAKKKIKNKNLQKTDFFNHTHYNALFLHLNKNSLRELQKKDKDIQVHKQCYGLDLSEVDIQRLEYVNILKKFAYEIVSNTLEAPSEIECENNPRNEYMLKALSGIRQLAQGNVIFRFQQVYGPQSGADDD